MARSKTSGSPAEVQVSHLFGTTLLDRLQVSKLRLLFEHLFPEKKIEQRGASTLLMNCFAPGHTDRKPSFYVYANLNFAKCKSCGYQTRNLLDMLQISLGITYAEAILKIFEITGQRVANDKVTKQLNALDVHQQATRIFGEVCNAHLINLITYCLNGAPVPEPDAPFYNDAVFHTVRPTLNWLYSQRHLDPSKVAYMPYGMLPTDTLFLRLAEKRLDELAGQMLLREGSIASSFSKDRRAEILASLKAMQKLVPAEYLHAVTFHTGHSTTLAGTIRMRKVSRDGGTDNNFWNLPGFSGHEPLGYLGLMQPRNSGLRRSDLAETKVLMVESEISMLAIQELLIEHSVPDVLVVASAGSNNDTEDLYRAGFTDVYALMDHPDPALGRGEDQIKIRLTTSLQIVVQVFTAWEEFRGGLITLKDPDDVLQHHGWGHFRKWVLDQMATSFVPADAWAADRAIEEGQNIPANNVLARQGKAVEFGHCVRHPALLAAFVARVSRELDIPAAPLRAAIVKIKDDEAGFVARIVEQLKTDFIVLYKDESKPGTLVLFHKADRRYITLNVTDGNAMVAALSNVYGEMFTYFVDHIGLPARKEGEDLIPAGLAIRDGQKLIGDYLKIAFQSIYQGVLTMDECTMIAAGGSLLPHPDDPDLWVYRFHNGDRWYRVIIDQRTSKVTAMELPGPIDGKFMFMPNQPTWSTAFNSVEDILATNDTDVGRLREIFDRFCEFVDAGWKLRSQRADVLYFAAYLMVLAAGDAFTIKSICRIIGESNSGKSSLQSMAGKGQYPELQLVEQSIYNTGYTQASTYAQHNRSSMNMILEEATLDAGAQTHKTKQLEDINEMLRQVIYEGGARIKRFGQNGRVIEYFVRCNVMMTAVQEPRDVQDANRSYILETVREDSRRDPVITLKKMSKTPDEFASLKRELQVVLLRHLPALRHAQDAIYQTLNEKQIGSYQAPTRFLRNFAPIAAILQLCGYDWEPLIALMIESRKDRLLSQAANSTSGIVFDKLLRAPIVPVPNSRNAFVSVMQCATMPNGYDLLNSSGIGVTLNPNNWTLIVDFVAATSPGGAMYRMNDLNKYTPHQLKALLDHHPDLVRPGRYKELGVMEALAANNITALEYEISVLTIGRLREQVMARAGNYTGVPMTVAGDAKQEPGIGGSNVNNI